MKKKISYVSRRTKNYNDIDSGGEDNEDKNEGNIVYNDTHGKEIIIRPNQKLKIYKDIFTNLMHTKYVKTEFPILSMCITQDSTSCITISK